MPRSWSSSAIARPPTMSSLSGDRGDRAVVQPREPQVVELVDHEVGAFPRLEGRCQHQHGLPIMVFTQGGYFMRVFLCFSILLFASLAAAQKPAAKVTFRLDWKPGAQQAVFYYARERGYYTQEGIDLQIIPGSGSSDSVKQVGSKAVDLALADALSMVQGAAQRVPVKSV